MIHKYFLFFIVLIFLFLFFYLKKQKENFDQPKWEKTLKCLKFNPEDIDTFKEDLLNGNNTNNLLSKTIRLSREKGLDDNQVFSCLIGDFKESL